MEEQIAAQPHENTSTDNHTIPAYTNYTFAAVYVLCTLVGVPGNILSLRYFLTKGLTVAQGANKAFFNIIYVLTTVVDILVSITLLPVIISFIEQRDAAWFRNSVFCHVWGIVWEMLPFMSVFLVGIMSISRTLVLIKPLYQLKKEALWAANIIYFIFLAGRTALPILMDDATYEYVYSDVYCYELPTADWSYKFNSISRSLTLAAPVIPICISCATSYIIILMNERRQNSVRRPSQAARKVTRQESERPNGKRLIRRKSAGPLNATMTILIFTVAYIVFNIPVFVNYLLMSIAGWSKNCVSDCYHKTYEDHPALIWYSWNFTYIMCVALNSTINPLIYYWRMNTVKSFVNEQLRASTKLMLRLNSADSDSVFSLRRISDAFRANYTRFTVSTAGTEDGTVDNNGTLYNTEGEPSCHMDTGLREVSSGDHALAVA